MHFNEIWHINRSHWKIKNAKQIFEKLCGVMITLKNSVFTRYASMNMLKFLLNAQFLCLWSHEVVENC